MPESILVKFFATFFLWFLFLGLGVLWVIDGKIKKEQVAHALLACLIAFAASLLIKYFFPTVRPFMLNGDGVGVIIPPTNGGFPSEHTTIAFALAVTVFMHDRKVGWYFLVSAIAVGVARVMANVHYPVDLIGGAFLGTITAVVVEKIHLFKLITRKYT
jgi:undecaprenyl-diphosphatase